jgi:HlyD family secretion protein
VKKLKIILLAAVLAAVGSAESCRGNSGGEYKLAAVARGDIVSTINATGTVEPEEVVDVGAQVAGRIISFGKDATGKQIDYGSAVEEGTVLAQIDDSLYAADAAQSSAQLEAAQAGVVRAQADLVQMKAKLDQALRDWERAQKLGPSEALAQTQYDAYKAAHEIAVANVAVDEAAIAQAQSAVSEAKASLQRAQRNLGYCTIVSPVKGVIIDRRVNIGQTVVSSLNAPSLFLIAKDLTRMQVWVSVNEADIGSIHPGQEVTFTVDAFPGDTFKGAVSRIRLNATMTQNVVTYTVEITTDNSNGRLLPYLTADVKFLVNKRENVLYVPNSALRWVPSADEIDPSAPAQNQPNGNAPTAEARPGTIWIQKGKYAWPVNVELGMTDGSVTEITGPDVKEGMSVIVGETSGTASQGGGTSNPFTPQIRRPSTGGQGGQTSQGSQPGQGGGQGGH